MNVWNLEPPSWPLSYVEKRKPFGAWNSPKKHNIVYVYKVSNVRMKVIQTSGTPIEFWLQPPIVDRLSLVISNLW